MINNDSQKDIVVRVGGEAGDGVISCGEIFAQAVSRTRYHVFTFISYPAEIRGGYSWIQIRIKDKTIYSMGGKIHYLFAFNQPAYDQSRKQLEQDGVVIYDPELVTLQKNSQGAGNCYPIPLSEISKKNGGKSQGKNILVLGILGALFGIKKEVLRKLLEERYAGKDAALIQSNSALLENGYEIAEKNLAQHSLVLNMQPDKKNDFIFLSGNQAVALAAIEAGCRFIAGYPITPATPIFETMTKILPLVGGRALQMEDEIAALSAVIGASFAGYKAMTATSGPGIQLMGEQINLASMIELPVVIVDVQRGGPSTGLPTKSEQSDLNFAVYGSTGEAPRIVLAPTSVQDTFYQTIHAFNLAERFQMPVILLLDQHIGYRKATVKMPDFQHIHMLEYDEQAKYIRVPMMKQIDLEFRREPLPAELKNYKRYKITETGISPLSLPGTPCGQYLSTGLEHNEAGMADSSPAVHAKMMKKRFKKLETLKQSLKLMATEYYGPEEAKIGVIGWGSTEGAIREARYLLEKEGIKIRHLHPRVISPLPEKQILHFLAGLKHLVIIEENYTGQLAQLIKAKFGVHPIEIHKYEGVPFNAEEIYRGLKRVAEIADEENITKL